MDYWYKDIDVKLKIRAFRVGGLEEDVDLGAVPFEYTGSSIRGLLRKSARKVANSLGIKSFERELFGCEEEEGKIQISVKAISVIKGHRYGIKIDPYFGSVKKGHLFSYSFLIADELNFKIRPVLGLTKDEARFLLYALNYLRYESIGGFGSRGMGLIEDVEICEEFLRFAGVKG